MEEHLNIRANIIPPSPYGDGRQFNSGRDGYYVVSGPGHVHVYCASEFDAQCTWEDIRRAYAHGFEIGIRSFHSSDTSHVADLLARIAELERVVMQQATYMMNGHPDECSNGYLGTKDLLKTADEIRNRNN